MNEKVLAALLPLVFLSSFAGTVKPASAFDGKFYATGTMMDFTDSTESEVSAYYGDPGSKKGTEMMSYLYSVISKDNSFVTYGTGVTKWYKITDRNWDLSRTIDPSSYRFSDDNDGNFRETLLYFGDNRTKAKAINTDVNGYTAVTTVSAVDWTAHTKPKEENAIQVDKEHVWVKSHGFSPSGDPVAGAGTDLHHLIAADHNTNNIHNDLYYGAVTAHDSSTEVYCYYADGTKEVSGWRGKTKLGEDAFEPTDAYKGDVARALFYMATRYSSEKETNTEAEPYLKLTDDNTLSDDNTHYHGVFHNLSTFLEWNETDPVDSYEKHRNNLIYKNVQNNRNPYVDHPEWVRRVYDPDYSGSYDFSSLRSSYHLHLGADHTLDIQKPVSTQETLSAVIADPTVLKLSDDLLTVTPLKAGKTTVTYTVKETGKDDQTYVTEISVADKVVITKMPYETGFKVTVVLPSTYPLPVSDVTGLFDGEKLTYESEDPGIVTVDSAGVLTPVKAGETKVLIYATLGEEKTLVSTVDVFVEIDKKMIYIAVIAVAAILLLIFIIVLIVLVRRSNKKDRRPTTSQKVYNTKKKKNHRR